MREPHATRRQLFAGAGALGVAAAMPLLAAHGTANATADAELIALADENDRLDARVGAIYARRHTTEDEEATEPELNAVEDRKDELLDRSLRLQAQTREGLRAKARIFLTRAEQHIGGDYVSNTCFTDSMFSLVEDVLGVEVVYGSD
jgi:hypothetical protein